MKTHLKNAASELFVPIMLLDDDVQRVRGMIDEVDRAYEGDFHRRLYVRCLFALIEGGIFFAKGVLLRAADESGKALSIDQRSLLEEKTYGIDDKGQIVSKTLFLRPKHNLQFVATIVKDWGFGTLNLKKDTAAWIAFSDCIDLRNRLTHPRPDRSVNVEDDQLAQLDLCYEWFNGIMNDLSLMTFSPKPESD